MLLKLFTKLLIMIYICTLMKGAELIASGKYNSKMIIKESEKIYIYRGE